MEAMHVVSCNVQKSAANTSILLEQNREADIVFVQENYWGRIKIIPSVRDNDGDTYMNTIAHAAFFCMGANENTRVTTYVNNRWKDASPQVHSEYVSLNDMHMISLRVNGERLYFINIYNDCKTHGASLELARVAETLPTITIMAGDFNLRHEAWEANASADRYAFTEVANQLVQTASGEMDMALLNEKGISTWQSNNPALRPRTLDLMWVSRTIADRVSEFQVDMDGRHRGDHALLKCCITRVERLEGKKQIACKSAAEAQYIKDVQEGIRGIAERYGELTTKERVQEATHELEQVMMAAWEQHAQPPRPSKHAKRWWNAACSKTAAEIRELRGRMRDQSNQREELKLAVESKQREFKKEVRRAKREHFEEAIKQTQERKVWDLVAWTRARKNDAFSTIKDSTGKTCGSTEEVGRAFHEQFTPTRQDGCDNTLVDEYPQLEPRSVSPISPQEVQECLATTSNTSAPGPDHCPWRYLKKIMGNEITEWIAKLFTACISLGAYPQFFKKALTIVIPKPNKPDYSRPKAYRPIVLLNCLAKLLEKIVAKRIQFDGQHFGILHPCQFGGTAHHSTTDAGTFLVHNIKEAWKKQLDSTVLLFDVAQFYPSLHHRTLIETMRKQGFGAEMCRFMSAYLENRETQYLINGTCSERVEVNEGVGQGSALSPILSALYIAPILHKWAPIRGKQFGNANMQFFVDDGLIHVAAVRDPAVEVQGDQLQLNCAIVAHLFQGIEADMNRAGLRVEPDKFEMMHFRRGRGVWSKEQPLGPDVILRARNGAQSHVTIKASSAMRYLGFILEPKLSWRRHIRLCCTKASSTISAIRMLGNSARGLSPTYKRRLYISNVLPILLYGAQLWWRPNWKGMGWALKSMAAVQSKAARWITGAFKTTRVGAMEMMAGLVPVRAQINTHMERAALRTCSLPENHPTRAVLRQRWTVNQFNIDAQFPVAPRRPENYTPMAVILQVAKDITEDSNLIHPECRPGERVRDKYHSRIQYHLKAPPKKSADFNSWFENFFMTVVDSIQDSNDNILVFTDGSKLKGKDDGETRTGAGWTVWRQRRPVESGAFPCGKATIYDVEMAAAAHGLQQAVDLVHDDPSVLVIHLFIDNKATAKKILDPSRGAAQMCAVQACQAARKFLSASEQRQIHVHWCPAHKNIDANEMVDKLAKEAAKSEQPLRYTVAMAKAHSRERAREEWREQLGPSLGPNFLISATSIQKCIRRKGHPWIEKTGLTHQEFARLTRFLTGHAPIGEYRERFNIPGPRQCACGAALETREHMVFDCPIWNRPWTRRRLSELSQQDALNFDQDRTYDMRLDEEKATTFLKINPQAATFEWVKVVDAVEAARLRGESNGEAVLEALAATEESRRRWSQWAANNPEGDPTEYTAEALAPSAVHIEAG